MAVVTIFRRKTCLPWLSEKWAITDETDDHYACVREEPEGRTLPLLTAVVRSSAERTDLGDKIRQRQRAGRTAMSSARNETIRK